MVDAGGYLPTFIVNSLLPAQLSIIEEARVAFTRDEEIDQAGFDALVSIMEVGGGEAYTPSELASIERIRKLATEVEIAEIDSPSHYVTMKTGVAEGNINMVGFAGNSLLRCAKFNVFDNIVNTAVTHQFRQ